jgi:hypothetical protein
MTQQISDESASVTIGELLKQMAAIHAQIAHLRYRRDSPSHATELAQLNDKLARLNEKLFGPALVRPTS